MRGHRAWEIVKAPRPKLLVRERRILDLRDGGQTLTRIAQRYAISRERVRQVEFTARRKVARGAQR